MIEINITAVPILFTNHKNVKLALTCVFKYRKKKRKKTISFQYLQW